jgi:hypothetical protein
MSSCRIDRLLGDTVQAGTNASGHSKEPSVGTRNRECRLRIGQADNACKGPNEDLRLVECMIATNR